MDCDFVPARDADCYICCNEGCGRKVCTKQLPIIAPCRSVTASPRTRTTNAGAAFIHRLTNFSIALAKHVLHGLPAAPKEIIQQRFQICAECPLFNGNACTHEDCGCRVGDQEKFLNKLAWADQACPLDPPKWTAEK